MIIGLTSPVCRGSFGTSCNSCKLAGEWPSAGSQVLTCTCGDGGGGYRSTSIDLSECIHELLLLRLLTLETDTIIGNNNGNFAC